MSHEQVVAIDSDERLRTLLAEAKPGEQFELTVGGKIVAKVVPTGPPFPNDHVQAVVDRIAERSKHMTLAGVPIKDLINEGRKF